MLAPTRVINPGEPADPHLVLPALLSRYSAEPSVGPMTAPIPLAAEKPDGGDTTHSAESRARRLVTMFVRRLTRDQHCLLLLVRPDNLICTLRPHRRESPASDPEEYCERSEQSETVTSAKAPQGQHKTAANRGAQCHGSRRLHPLRINPISMTITARPGGSIITHIGEEAPQDLSSDAADVERR